MDEEVSVRGIGDGQVTPHPMSSMPGGWTGTGINRTMTCTVGKSK